jgi:hypothetical protein
MATIFGSMDAETRAWLYEQLKREFESRASDTDALARHQSPASIPEPARSFEKPEQCPRPVGRWNKS